MRRSQAQPQHIKNSDFWTFVKKLVFLQPRYVPYLNVG